MGGAHLSLLANGGPLGPKKKRLVYVAGVAHCGSTATDFLLGRFLGRSCGQLVDLGALVNPDGSLNELAVSRANVPFWREFLLQLSPETRAEFHAIFKEITSERKVIGYGLSPGKRKDLARLFDRSVPFVYDYLGCDTLIDSSKNVTRALGLQKSELCDVYVIHLVRDPADFLASVAKRRGGSQTTLQQINWLIHWATKNALASILRFYFGKRYFRIDYRTLFLRPYETLQPLFREFDIDFSRSDFERIFAEKRQEPEIVAGNRLRVQRTIELGYRSVPGAELDAIRPPARFFSYLLERAVLGDCPSEPESEDREDSAKVVAGL